MRATLVRSHGDLLAEADIVEVQTQVRAFKASRSEPSFHLGGFKIQAKPAEGVLCAAFQKVILRRPTRQKVDERPSSSGAISDDRIARGRR